MCFNILYFFLIFQHTKYTLKTHEIHDLKKKILDLEIFSINYVLFYLFFLKKIYVLNIQKGRFKNRK